MNKRSVKKVRSAKSSRREAVRKAPVKATARKTSARQPVRKREVPIVEAPRVEAQRVEAQSVGEPITISAVTVAQVVARTSGLRSHKYRVGQTVFYTSSPISRPGATGSYQVVRLLPSDGDDYQYRIKNPGEAFERVAKESQLELEH